MNSLRLGWACVDRGAISRIAVTIAMAEKRIATFVSMKVVKHRSYRRWRNHTNVRENGFRWGRGFKMDFRFPEGDRVRPHLYVAASGGYCLEQAGLRDTLAQRK
jgi:hypothetical protein